MTVSTGLAETGPFGAQARMDFAASFENPQRLDSRGSGDVAAVKITAQGTRFVGVSIDVPCSMGFCAEAGAIGAMITARESHIVQAVTVTRDADGQPLVSPPCGRCREFAYQIDHRNRAAETALAADRVVRLQDLLPELWN